MNCILCKRCSRFIYHFPFISLYRCPLCTLIFSGKNRHPLRTLDWGQEMEELDEYYFKQFIKKDQNSIKLLQKHHLMNPGKILDIGCAAGSFFARMREYGWEVSGVEPSPALCKIAKEKYGLRLINAEFDPRLFRQKFDLVTIFDVLEHLTNPKHFLQQIMKVLKSGGFILCKVPNWNSLTVQCCLLSYALSFGK